MIVACALFHDVLKPANTFCKVLQSDEVCIISAFKSVLRTVLKHSRVFHLRNFPLSRRSLEGLPTVDMHQFTRLISRL